MGNIVGILHPGQMGIALAISAQMSGNTVLWVSKGRSSASRARAEGAGLVDAETLEELCGQVQILFSVCPPEFAEQLANQVLTTGYRGVYLDANAISPERAQRIGARMSAAGVEFVDGGIIGLPSTHPGETWLHVSGAAAPLIAACMAAGPTTVNVMGEEVGRASALKMCYAGFNKGSIALSAAIAAAAHRLNVYPDLAKEWDRIGPDSERVRARLLRAAPKAWRWAGEMHEVSQTLDAEGLPGEFHEAAAEVYERLREMKDELNPAFEEIMRRLNRTA